MDPFEFRDEAVQPASNTSAIVWNILTAIVILTALCIVGVFTIVLINPAGEPTRSSTNFTGAGGIPTATPLLLIVLPPTWT
jgi:uncharacterized BrkB/YihY/UPF0761 family membrane protein